MWLSARSAVGVCRTQTLYGETRLVNVTKLRIASGMPPFQGWGMLGHFYAGLSPCAYIFSPYRASAITATS